MVGPPILITIMVNKAISQMKAGKAPGPSGIVVEMIRAAGDMGASVIRDLAAAIIRDGEVPSDWEQRFIVCRGWSGGAMVLGKLPVPGRPTILITVGQGPIALAVGAGGGGLDILTLHYPFFSFSLSLGDGPI